MVFFSLKKRAITVFNTWDFSVVLNVKATRILCTHSYSYSDFFAAVAQRPVLVRSVILSLSPQSGSQSVSQSVSKRRSVGTVGTSTVHNVLVQYRNL